MSSVADVRRVVAGFPETVEAPSRQGHPGWSVRGKAFAWERQFSKADLRRYGDEPVPDGPILALMTADLVEKEAVLAQGQAGVFTIPHFANYPAYLMQLSVVDRRMLKEALVDAWLARAPAELAEQYLKRRRKPSGPRL